MFLFGVGETELPHGDSGMKYWGGAGIDRGQTENRRVGMRTRLRLKVVRIALLECSGKEHVKDIKVGQDL